MSTKQDQCHRLEQGGRIDRSQPLTFTWNGKQYQGYKGDTLASAMLANGIKIVGRSFKYSRPRGIFGHGAEEANALMQLGVGKETIPNPRATQIELFDGLTATATNGWPSADFDLMEWVGKIGGKMMPPGFYYKTFMWPEKMWMTYEKFIRKAAGYGKASLEADPDIYDKLNRHCDVMVVGAGPAGLAAALEAGRAGKRVIIADEQDEFGGSLLASKQTINGQAAAAWAESAAAELAAMDNVLCLSRTTVFGYYDHNFLGALERRTDHEGMTAKSGSRQRIHRIRAHEVVLAAGALERPLVFANNDLPGVMLSGSVATYINRYGVVPGNRCVVMTTNDSGYQTALDITAAGRTVVAIVDTRQQPEGRLIEAARAAGIVIKAGHAVIEAQGSKQVTDALVAPIDAAGEQITGKPVSLSCDLIAVAGGWSPVVHLSCHTGSRPQWNDTIAAFVPGPSVQRQHLAGAVNGEYTTVGALQAGAQMGALAAGSEATTSYDCGDESVGLAQALYLVPHTKPVSRAPKQFVDFQNDVTAAGIELANREGFESIEHVKRYTAMGFGTDQGKTGNINGMAITAKNLGKTIAETGTTIFRPAYTPVTFGAMGGRDIGELLDPARHTAMHPWHVENGALFENVGQWKRPWYYPKAGETMQQALNRECMAVRNSVGILDASTLGKIDIQGRDAREFLNRVYTNAWSKLAPGKCRYGLMLKEDGMVFDDGVTACLDDNHFLMTTTSGGAAAVLSWLEMWHQTEWPELEVYFTSVTDQWATCSFSGPNARKVLAKLCDDVDLSAEAFKFMDWRAGTVAGVKARIFRISFTGELAYEVNVPANQGLYMWQQIVAAGAEFGITPYGTETMHVLRAEKGYIIVGQDTDGSLTPQDCGMHWIVGKNKDFSFLGKRSFTRPDTSREDRKHLVGLKPKDPTVVLPEGAQIVPDPKQPIPMDMLGHVTSSYWSECLGHGIALATVKSGHHKMGDTVYCPLADGRVLAAEICSPVFYDPKGERHND
ncbi:MAG: sarcosine oxidase subunit alpha family protein [Gammaproteobacteria bacterium]|jgi:sarcosine oxidase subunit alpha|nr:sarcosine oxidase subunit alpha family protein [Gammaproteobacteria bacterium]